MIVVDGKRTYLVRCPRCLRLTLNASYCMWCGAKLQHKKDEEKEKSNIEKLIEDLKAKLLSGKISLEDYIIKVYLLKRSP